MPARLVVVTVSMLLKRPPPWRHRCPLQTFSSAGSKSNGSGSKSNGSKSNDNDSKGSWQPSRRQIDLMHTRLLADQPLQVGRLGCRKLMYMLAHMHMPTRKRKGVVGRSPKVKPRHKNQMHRCRTTASTPAAYRALNQGASSAAS